MNLKICSLSVLTGLVVVSTGCSWLPKQGADAQSQPAKTAAPATETAVDVAIARTGSLREELLYTGTTRPVREVSLRPQVEGKLLSLNVDVGDAVEQGQPLARLDDALLVAGVVQAEAELAARESEVARSQTQVTNAQTKVEEARLKLQQAMADADRLQKLYQEGAVSQQAAEQGRTAAQTAEQVLRSAQAQVSTEEQAVAAARGRVTAQKALVEQAKERLSYAILNAPITGIVTQRLTETGNLLQPGTEIIKIGDFSQVKIVVDVSELELSKIRPGQSVAVQLDAFPQQEFIGSVSRISPAADPVARLVPVEMTIPNSNNIGSGLLARVRFASAQVERILIPESALEAGGRGRGRGGERAKSKPESKSNKSPGEGGNSAKEKSKEGTIFVVQEKGEKPIVESRQVQLGERANGLVEIISGLAPGERFVSRSGKPLKDKETVRLSVLSEK